MEQQVALFTTTEVARAYGVDTSTVRRWVATGVLKPEITTPGGHYRFAASALPSDARQAVSA